MEKSKQSITIKKIKRDHKYRLTIEYEKMVDGHTTEYTARFDEEPAPELTQAFNRLSIAACQALEFGDVTNYAARVHVLAVAYGEKSDGREYAILTMRYRNPLSGSETTINTAQWPWPMTESEAKEPGFIDDRSGSSSMTCEKKPGGTSLAIARSSSSSLISKMRIRRLPEVGKS